MTATRSAQPPSDLPRAEKHLAALREICLLPCEALTDLERAVVEYRGGKR